MNGSSKLPIEEKMLSEFSVMEVATVAGLFLLLSYIFGSTKTKDGVKDIAFLYFFMTFIGILFEKWH